MIFKPEGNVANNTLYAESKVIQTEKGVRDAGHNNSYHSGKFRGGSMLSDGLAEQIMMAGPFRAVVRSAVLNLSTSVYGFAVRPRCFAWGHAVIAEHTGKLSCTTRS